jgi:hypothetical protein
VLQRNQLVSLYGIHVNPTRPTQFVVGGVEEYVYVYDARMIREERASLHTSPLVQPLERHCPARIASNSREPFNHVTACVFSRRGELLVTYNEDDIYLFHPWLKGVKTEPHSDEVQAHHQTAWAACRQHQHAQRVQPANRALGTGDVLNAGALQEGWKRRRAGSGDTVNRSPSKRSCNDSATASPKGSGSSAPVARAQRAQRKPRRTAPSNVLSLPAVAVFSAGARCMRSAVQHCHWCAGCASQSAAQHDAG